MKKLFTLIAFLAVVMGAKAEWVDDYMIDYSTKTGFPFYVMGYVPEWVDGVMTDYGALYRYATDAEMEEGKDGALKDGESIVGSATTGSGVVYNKISVPSGAWHQYFIADGIPTEIDGAYRITAMVKASDACSINVNMQWGWGSGQQIANNVAIGTEWQEVEWEYSGIGGTSCALIAQPGGTQATIEWKWVKVSHNQKDKRPTVWLEQLTNGDAETPWGDLADVKYDDMENNFKICAWAKEKGTNVNAEGGSDPHPAEIVAVDADHGHAFIVRGAVADTEGDPSAWDNQFWIESPKVWKNGTQIKISFDYKADAPAKADTQYHKQKPSDYKHWEAVGEVAFSTEWQHLEKVVTVPDATNNEAWSIAFNLNKDNKDANNFYFDNLSWSEMQLDHGYFIAGANTKIGLEYDLDNAIEFTYDEDQDLYIATVGEEKDADTWVNQIMISTVRGDDAAFKTNTLKPEGAIQNDPDNWMTYAPVGIAKLNLPSAGAWKVCLDPVYTAMTFEMLAGEAPREPLDIKPNPTEIIINATERDWKPAKTGDGVPENTPQDGEEGIGTGQPWDNQFFLKADRVLETGEEVVIEFDYMATAAAPAGTQCQNGNFGYIHWDALGTINFTTEWQHYTKTYTVPADCKNELQVFAFNLSEIKAANEYHIKNIVWKTADNFETLIDMNTDNGKNFFVKTNSGGVEPNGIKTVNTTSVRTNAMYNLAGQRVSKDFKGIAIKNGQKFIVK